MSDFNWAEFLRVANNLAKEEDEACLRAAISRVYYAVYWRARKYLEAQRNKNINDTINRSANKHDVIWQFYEADMAAPRKTIQMEGLRLRDQRTVADYKDWIRVTRNDWDQAYVRAEMILKFFDTIDQ